MRVLDTFHHKDHSPLQISYFFEDISWRHQRERTRLYHHPFMVVGCSDPSDLIVLGYLERNSLTLCPLKHMIKRILTLRGYEYSFNVLTTMLKDRKTTLHAVVFDPILFIEMRRFILGCTSPSLTLCGTRM
jgi:hypothetical protein